jgi:uncharacterized membrane protein YkoI
MYIVKRRSESSDAGQFRVMMTTACTDIIHGQPQTNLPLRSGLQVKSIGGMHMYRVIALAMAIAATTSVAGAQAATTAAKTTVKTGAVVRHRRTVKKEESQAVLLKEAKISEATARSTALARVPNGSVKSSEIERENGKLIYSFDITVPGKTGIEEVNVNAIDGSVVGQAHETPKSEKKEAVMEAKEKKTKN